MADTYRVNECFYSPQGEGMRAGEMSLFLRLTGCNMRCRVEPGDKSPGGFDCDTEFESGRALELEQVLQLLHDELRHGIGGEPPAGWRPWVVLTGGEPGLQVDARLCAALHDAGMRVAIETNGSINLDHLELDWVTVSPKVAEHAIKQRRANEVKYVRGYGQAIPRTVVVADHQLISPAHDGLAVDRRTMEWCLELVRRHPDWRLSVQQHKSWRVR